MVGATSTRVFGRTNVYPAPRLQPMGPLLPFPRASGDITAPRSPRKLGNPVPLFRGGNARFWHPPPPRSDVASVPPVSFQTTAGGNSKLASHTHATLLTSHIPDGLAWNREGLLRHCDIESTPTAKGRQIFWLAVERRQRGGGTQGGWLHSSGNREAHRTRRCWFSSRRRRVTHCSR